MKKLRLFDSLKLVLAAVACIFAFAPAHADIPAGYTQITSSDTTNYPNTLTGYTKYTITNASWEYVSASSGGEGYIRYQISPENIVGGGAQISNMFKRASISASNKVIGFVVYYSTGVRKTFVSVRDNIKFTDVSAQTYFTAHPLIILVKTTTATDNVYQLVKRDSDGVIGYYCATGTNAGDFVPAFGAMEYNQIKIATTRYNEESFAPVKTDLSAAVDAVDDVVSRTMTQAQAIDTIATTKQTRPDEGCPAKYCLLVEDEDGTPHWYPIAGANGVEYVLPAGYTQLEYIESNGSQYINTGIYATQNTAIETKFINLSGASTTSVMIGDGWNNGEYQFSIVAQTGAPNRIGGLNRSLNNFWTTNREFIVQMNKTGLYVDGELLGWNGSATEFTSTNPLTLLGDATSRRGATVKLFYMKIYENDTMVRNFIPAKNSSGVVGLYDLADANPATAFYTNAGTGNFTASPDM